ncbi:MAG: sialate O-acetylesterase, partial [Paramuribaculum sp.]|nr:sialate O-acetylesterase [Paramuribaculum sp.]
MKRLLPSIILLLLQALTLRAATDTPADSAREVAIFITIGQSNADGSAMFCPKLDSIARQWFESPANTRRLKIWYRSTQVRNLEANALGERARHVIDGAVTDVAPGWLDLWYRNENTSGRTAMNMIHGYGTYSTGSGTDCAQGRRGMEPQLGIDFASALPATDLYFIKLGVSGSQISTWANPDDDNNWNYFMANIYRPAIADLTSRGLRPRLAGIWWMQGCADSSRPADYYEASLRRLVDRLETELGFAEPPIYIGTLTGQFESPAQPAGSPAQSPNVRAAQQAVAADHPNVTLVDTAPFPMQ